MQLLNEIIVDSFAGGGGVSVGIELATGKPVTIAINHDPQAIAMHKVNHPNTKHYIEDIWKVDPVEAAAGRPVGLAWFSPDCKHHSKARGGKPRDKNIRGLAWVAVKWAMKVKPRVIILENVEEFQDWGPLLEDNQPDPKRKGETFQLFVQALRRQGYKVEWRELRACDYGAPTIRKRFFLIARRDGKPIVWPKPTHGNPKSQEVKEGKLLSWRTAAEIIDWSIPCPSIFERKKPLAENTMKRIARGLKKFIFDNPEPFIVQVNHRGEGFRGQNINDPLQTITAKHGYGLVTPTLMVNEFNNVGGSVTEPLKTILTGNHHYLVTPFISSYHSETAENEARGLKVDEPIHTIDASNRHALVTAFISKYYGGNYNGAGADLDEPVPTITSKDHNAIVTSHLIKLKGTNIGSPVTEPVHTITAGGLHMGEVRAFLLKYYGSDVGQDCKDPLHTVTVKDRFGLVTIQGCDYQIVDIGMRMLTPRELFNAQGFPVDYIIDHDDQGKPYPQYAQVARCGNAVPPQLPKALVQANLPELCGLDYVEGLEQEPYYEQISLFGNGKIS